MRGPGASPAASPIDINGAASFEKPIGSPWLRSTMWVLSGPTARQVYVVAIGNGPWAVRIATCSPGVYSVTSYVWRRGRGRGTGLGT